MVDVQWLFRFWEKKSHLPTIFAKSLGTLAVLFRLFDYHPPLPLKTMLVYGRYTRSTLANLPADNSRGYIRLTQHCFKGGGGGYPLL